MRIVNVTLLLLVALVSGRAAAFEAPEYPRLAALWLGNQKYHETTVQQQLARSNVVIINTWPGWDKDTAGGVTLDTVVKNIKARNPNSLVFNYILNEAIPTKFHYTTELVSKADSMRWWLYANGSSGTPIDSFYGQGFVTVNNMLWVPRDSNGDRWVEWYAKWAHRNLAAPNPSLDGFFLDNVFTKPAVNGDWNRDGTTDSKSDLTVGTWQRQGLARHFDIMKELMPGKLQIGNISEWGHPENSLTDISGKLNGGLMEATIGKSWSVESWGTWADMMRWYRKTMVNIAAPKLVVFHQVGSPLDYQSFRYGFTSCLLDDGYFAFNSSDAYVDTPYFDEYSVKLGKAVSPPPSSAWKNGVFRRDFEKGIILVNPKNNGAREILLEADFQKVKGPQDPTVNDGAIARSVTLKDRDGLVLLRVGADTAQPKAPSSVVVQ